MYYLLKHYRTIRCLEPTLVLWNASIPRTDIDTLSRLSAHVSPSLKVLAENVAYQVLASAVHCLASVPSVWHIKTQAKTFRKESPLHAHSYCNLIFDARAPYREARAAINGSTVQRGTGTEISSRHFVWFLYFIYYLYIYLFFLHLQHCIKNLIITKKILLPPKRRAWAWARAESSFG